MSDLTAQKHYNKLIEEGKAFDFTKLTSTGISSNYEKVFEFAESYFKALTQANEDGKKAEKALSIQDVSHCFFYDNELNHIRQWFNTTIDQNQDKDIEKTEWKLALKIHKYLNITPENRIVKNCG